MKIKDIMTTEAIKSCGPETALHLAAETMRVGNCGALPVIDSNQKVLGIVTDRDIALSLTRSNKASIIGSPVKDVMSAQVHTVKESDDINIALEKMRINKIGRLPVVNGDNQLKGMLSIHNLLSSSVNEETMNGKITEGESLIRTIKALSDRYSHVENAQ